MIKVEKEVKVEITGEDVKALSDVCELARRFLNRHSITGEWQEHEQIVIRQFMNQILDAGLT